MLQFRIPLGDSMRRLAILVYICAAGLACERQSPDLTGEELIRRSIPRDLGFPPGLAFEVDTSRAVPGLRYVRGSYSGATDVEFVHGALEIDGRAVPVYEVADWVTFVQDIDWRPAGSADALAACTELVRHVVHRASPARYAVIYQDSSSLADPRRTLIVDPQRSAIQPFLRPPEARQDSSGTWVVRHWILYGAWSAQYQCTIGEERRELRVNVAVVDSLNRYW